MANTETESDYHNEAEMCGLYAGGILGGLVLGSFGDLINSEMNSMAFYIGGCVLGAIAGAIAGRVFRAVA
jgi:hypothetical protein